MAAAILTAVIGEGRLDETQPMSVIDPERKAAADKALDHDPASVCAMSLKAEVFCRTGDRDRAVESLQALRRQRFS